MKRAESFLEGFSIDKVDEVICGHAASLHRQRPSLRTPDALILATALTRGCILVTRNVKDFAVTMPGIRVPYQL